MPLSIGCFRKTAINRRIPDLLRPRLYPAKDDEQRQQKPENCGKQHLIAIEMSHGGSVKQDGLAKSQMPLVDPQESGRILLAQRKNSAALLLEARH